MKKELLKLQSRNREINARLDEMYSKAESEKREFTAEEAMEEKSLKRELEQNHREIMLSNDEAAIGQLREQKKKRNIRKKQQKAIIIMAIAVVLLAIALIVILIIILIILIIVKTNKKKKVNNSKKAQTEKVEVLNI